MEKPRWFLSWEADTDFCFLLPAIALMVADDMKGVCIFLGPFGISLGYGVIGEE